MNGSCRNVLLRWRSGRKRNMRRDNPSPSRASAPNGRWGPCTSSGEQVTSTTLLARSIWSNFRLVSVSQRRSVGAGTRPRWNQTTVIVSAVTYSYSYTYPYTYTFARRVRVRVRCWCSETALPVLFFEVDAVGLCKVLDSGPVG